MESRIGDIYQQETKYARDKIPSAGPDWLTRPGLYKEYPANNRVSLPPPEQMGKLSLDQALKKRKSVRSYASKPLSREQLTYLLWSSTGIQRREGGREYRTVPSAGGLYPVETYLVVNNVEDVPQGVYHYSVKQHILEELQTGDFSRPVTAAALGQRMCLQAAVVFIWTAIFQRSKWKYGERAYRYIYLDAGHMAQNLALSAVSLGLGSCHIGALFDEEVNSIVQVDGIDESVVYMTIAGWPSE